MKRTEADSNPGRRVGRSLGETLRQVRAESQLSIRDLAQLTGVSPASIHKIENDSVSPTVGTLFKIARGLNKTVSFFIGEEEQDGSGQVSFTPRQSRTLLRTGRPRLRTERIVGSIADHGMDALNLVIPPGEGSGKEALQHAGEEIAMCLRGSVDFRIAGQKYRLAAGDTLYFKATLPHAWANRGRKAAELVIVCAPPVVL